MDIPHWRSVYNRTDPDLPATADAFFSGRPRVRRAVVVVDQVEADYYRWLAGRLPPNDRRLKRVLDEWDKSAFRDLVTENLAEAGYDSY